MSTFTKVKIVIPLVLIFGAYVKWFNPITVQLFLVLLMGLYILAAWIPPQAAKARRSATQKAKTIYHENPIARSHRRWEKFWKKRSKKRRQRNRAYQMIQERELKAVIDSAMKDFDRQRDEIVKRIVDKYLEDN